MNTLDWCKYEREVRAWVKEQGKNSDKVVFYRDGIVDEVSWNSEGNFKILFILKEVHDGEDCQDLILTDGMNWQNICHHSDVIGDEAETTWRKLSTLAEGFYRALTYNKKIKAEDYELHKKPSEDKEENKHIKSVKKIAIINLKKLGAGKNTGSAESINTIEYEKHCEKFHNEIKTQIEEIAPQIIVCCSPCVFGILNKYVYPENKNINESYVKDNGVVVIKAYHPTASKSYNDYYVNPINSCLELYNK